MPKKYIIAAALLYTTQAFAQVNYVRTWEARIPITDAATIASRPVTEALQTTAYIDGLGRPLQTVVKQGSLFTKAGASTAGDIVSTFEYDVLGREVKKYLPYAAAATDGALKNNPLSEQNSFYNSQLSGQNEYYFYSNTDVEASPLNRTVKTYAAGNSWVGSLRGNGMQYFNNTADDDVKPMQVNAAGNCVITPTPYSAGKLIELHTTDEHGSQVVEYKDLEGKLLLKKVQASATITESYDGWLCTYYVYDIYNNLRLVIQPKGVNQLRANSWTFGNSTGTTILEENCFSYQYDTDNRMSIKKVPGAAEVYMIYDKWDRLVLTQDGNLRVNNKWIFTKYDYLCRPVITGFYQNGSAIGQAAMQSYVNTQATGSVATFESLNTGTGSIGYSTTASFPSVTSPDLLSITFYDNYNWAGSYNTAYTGFNTRDITDDGLFYSTGTSLYAQALMQSSKTKGLVTGMVTYILNSSTGQKLVSSVFYDDYGRTVQTRAGNITGGIDITTTQYNFSNQPLMTVQLHNTVAAPSGGSGGTPQSVKTITKISYDDLGRLKDIKKKITQTIGSTTIPATPVEKTIVKNEYDKLGQLVRKTLAPAYNSNNGLEKLDYEYNVRGWMLGFNKDYVSGSNTSSYFGMELAYDKTATNTSGTSYANPQYNGNIAGTIWKSRGDEVNRQYDFGYDKVNRILKGDFKQKNSNGSWNNSEVNYNMQMGTNGTDNGTAYDENGNIQQMQQWGLKINTSGQIDNLGYQYFNGGNKLSSVTDATGELAKLGDFKDGNGGTDDYAYDVNGNMVIDKNKKIFDASGFFTMPGISYNHLNLPATIKVDDKGTIDYVYDAGGNKLRKITHEDAKPGHPAVTKTTTYIAGMVYEDDVLQFAGSEEGRIRYKPAAGAVPANFVYDYFIKDHLGNVRMVLTDEAQVDKYPVASLEPSKVNTEDDYYTIDQSKIVASSAVSGLPAYTNDNGIGNNPSDPVFEAANSANLYQLNSSSNKTGLGITLKVMAGDKLDVFGKSYYFTNNPGSNSSVPVLDILNGLLGSPLAAGTVNAHGQVTATDINTTAGTAGIGSMMATQNTQSSANPLKPRAFINVIFFDEQFKAVDYRVSMVGTNSTLKSHYPDLQNIAAPKNGFVYIYCSNETPVDVFFDNIQVVHTRGQILEETHYYPFGLTMAGISSKGANTLENKRKWNAGSELESKEFSDGSGLELYSTQYRSLDPQLGKFWQIDPQPKDDESAYAAMGNNPISRHDPLGDTDSIPQQRSAKTGILNGLKNFGNGLLSMAFPQLAGLKFLQYAKKNPKGAFRTILEAAYPQIKVQKDIKAFVNGDAQTRAQLTTEYALNGLTLIIGAKIGGGNTPKNTVSIISEGNLSAAGQSVLDVLQSNTSLKNSFTGGNFQMITAETDLTIYRVFGGESGMQGRFFTTVKPSTSAQAEQMLNINAYGNAGTEVVPVTIKAGTQFAYGPVAGGTGNQIFIQGQQSNIIYQSNLAQALK